MSIEQVLRSTLPMLDSMHILGAESHIMEGVKNNIRSVIRAIDQAKEEAANANRNGQREDV